VVVEEERGQLYIINFGLAKRLEGGKDSLYGFVGTEQWTAPEVGEYKGSLQ
jgi:serine/threonine protein kinase